MISSFRMTRAEVVGSDTATLKASIVEATGSESGADSIMRSLERMLDDASIEHFEMTEVSGRRRFGAVGTPGWRVRADRGVREESAG